MSNPLPIIPLEYAHVGLPTRPMKRLRSVALFAWLLGLLAWTLIVFVRIDSVLVTGPLIFLTGLMLLISGVQERSVPYLFLAAAHCAVCLLFFVLVNRLDWSEEQAYVPFTVMGAAFVSGSGIATFLLARHDPDKVSASLMKAA